MPIEAIWFVAGLALLVLELASTSFYAIFLAGGAFAAGILALLLPGAPVWIDAIVAIGVAMGGVVLVRPLLARRMRRRGALRGSPGVHGGFVGERALALDEVGDVLHPGHVRLAGETWLAFSEGDPITTDVPVIVTAVRGTTLVVRPADRAALTED